MNGTLTEVCTRVRAEVRNCDEAMQEARGFSAPSECYGTIVRHSFEALIAIMDEAGITAEEYDDMLRERTTPKWAMFEGHSGEALQAWCCLRDDGRILSDIAYYH